MQLSEIWGYDGGEESIVVSWVEERGCKFLRNVGNHLQE
jgi:hypothetical protein